MSIPLKVDTTDKAIGLTVTTGGNISVTPATTVTAAIGEHYTGETTVTPGDAPTTLATAGMIMDADVVIRPVPSNYGRLIWDNGILTVY